VLPQHRHSTSPSLHAACYKNWDFGLQRLRGCRGRLRGETCSCSLALNAVRGSLGMQSLSAAVLGWGRGRAPAWGAMAMDASSVSAVPQAKSGGVGQRGGWGVAVSQRGPPSSSPVAVGGRGCVAVPALTADRQSPSSPSCSGV